MEWELVFKEVAWCWSAVADLVLCGGLLSLLLHLLDGTLKALVSKDVHSRKSPVSGRSGSQGQQQVPLKEVESSFELVQRFEDVL